jgi:hypothetical protein
MMWAVLDLASTAVVVLGLGLPLLLAALLR